MLQGVLIRARAQRATAALEAMFSLVFIFIWLLAVWTGAIAIFNQSQTETAAQVASQGAITVIDRTWDGRADDSWVYTDISQPEAQNAAASLVSMNSLGLANSDDGTKVSGAAAPIVQCWISPLSSPVISFGSGCGQPGAPDAGSIKVEISTQQQSSFMLLGGLGDLTKHSFTHVVQAKADAVSMIGRSCAASGSQGGQGAC